MKKSLLSSLMRLLSFFGLISFNLCFSQAQESGDSGLVDDTVVMKDLEASPEEKLVEETEMIDQLERLNEISEGDLDFKSFIYSEKGRRDPFQKPGGLEKAPTVSTDVITPETTGLEGYDLSSFQLTAVMWGIKYPKALVKAAENEVYVIEEGTKIGRRNGYVAKIREGEIVVIEPNIQNDKKKTTLYKTQVLKLGR